MSLLEKTALPYQAPYFSQIKSEDFAPALLEAMTLQQQAITAIVQQTAPPSFDNTVLALEKSGEALLRVANLFFALAGADTNEVLQQTEKEILPLLAANEDSIYLNDKLFERIEVLYQQRASLSLDSESLKLLEHYYDLFSLRGANLSPEKKEALKEINNRLASLENDFNYNTLQARHQAALSIEKEEDLLGLSPEEQKMLLQEDGSWKIALTNSSLSWKRKNRVTASFNSHGIGLLKGLSLLKILYWKSSRCVRRKQRSWVMITMRNGLCKRV